MKRSFFILPVFFLIMLIILNCSADKTKNDEDEAPSRMKVLSIATGANHTVVLLNDGSVKCWGHNLNGQLGYGNTNNIGDVPGEMGNNLLPVDLGAGRSVVKIDVGENHTVVLLDNGTVKCWGDNEYGQLGYGDTEDRGDEPGEMGNNLLPVDLGTGRTALQIAAGYNHTIALLDNGTIKCWGRNYYGRLGYGDTDNRGDEPGEMGNNLLPVDLGTGRRAIQIATGYTHTAALLDNGTVKCWGDNYWGALGYGDIENRGDESGEMGNDLLPVDLGTGRTAVQLSCGENFVAAILDNGTVKCWGLNQGGQSGYGDIEDRGDEPGEMGNDLLPVDLGIGGTGRITVKIVSGISFTIVLFDNGTIKCWGRNNYGQLGYGNTNYRGDNPGEMGVNLPLVDIGSGIRIRNIAAGEHYAVVLLEDGTIKCWGENTYGQLGYGNIEWRGDEPGEMGDNLPFVN